MLSCVFFFQAEDGIRDLVRSRGLGDVYKRQGETGGGLLGRLRHEAEETEQQAHRRGGLAHQPGAVSYTHLTLPTSDLV